jgi:hypothetical protein
MWRGAEKDTAGGFNPRARGCRLAVCTRRPCLRGLERGKGRAPMRGMLAPLSSREEAALRKVGFGSDDPLEPAYVRRLLQLELIAWSGGRWAVTELGVAALAAWEIRRRLATRRAWRPQAPGRLPRLPRIGGVLACQRPNHLDQLTWFIRLAEEKPRLRSASSGVSSIAGTPAAT